MNSITISTDAVAEKERPEYWQETVSRTLLALRTERKTREPFFGQFEHRQVGYLPLTFLHSSPQRVYRSHAEIARVSREVYFVCMQLVGTARVSQGREERWSSPGDLELIDGTRSGELSFDREYRRLVISVPHHVLRPRLTHADQMVDGVWLSS